MKKSLLYLMIFTGFCKTAAQTTVNVFSQIVFYDGYAANVSEPVPANTIRLANYRYTKKLSDTELNSFQNKIQMNVTIGALCDNYDRIGGVHLALVPKGQASYTLNDTGVKRIEIGRYITPFMNKNLSPTEVPYSYQVDNLYSVFSNTAIRAAYDIWIELDVFGVPYAANTQVSGCAGRNDVFAGTLSFVTYNDSSVNTTYNNILPLLDSNELNNYNNTDQAGQTVRLVNFNLTQSATNAKFFIVSTPHGANTNGEEYVRRQNFVSLDNNQVLTFTPGGISCEPFRVYNTQGNGIYGTSVHSTSWWTSWNNWCPGNAVPIRSFTTASLSAGNHTIKYEVPSAVFYGQDGRIVLSMYMQSTSQQLSVKDVSTVDVSVFPNPTTDFVNIRSDKKTRSITVYSAEGRKLNEVKDSKVDLSAYPAGVYMLYIILEGGIQFKHKIIKK
ncbi:Por secretion system C-terminal sorting domain-containing protein [Chryseobacterium taichungense]|uniref:Por secretion system C-terminal sorting domain-containing protein n=1 Tax=Chryseobacterium taichungense TaxID=295069 RepID=A0A1H7ZK33_9FLAO|nr:peptide-N-glycosidase F-related protein [Chryseobacterium taichungense]SEM58686.1 Por secretion system C-terminal sorting domain-containing protein [Chryseobacterium taichungense]